MCRHHNDAIALAVRWNKGGMSILGLSGIWKSGSSEVRAEIFRIVLGTGKLRGTTKREREISSVVSDSYITSVASATFACSSLLSVSDFLFPCSICSARLVCFTCVLPLSSVLPSSVHFEMLGANLSRACAC